MVRRLFTLLLALVGLTSAWAEDYPVTINGVQLTSDNYTNFTNSNIMAKSWSRYLGYSIRPVRNQ